jgi:hypothetical protein
MTQPSDGSQIPWGKGALVDSSKAAPPPPWIANSANGNPSPEDFSLSSPILESQSQSTSFSSSIVPPSGGDIGGEGDSYRVSINTISRTEIERPLSTGSSVPLSSATVRRFRSSVDILHLVLPLDTTVLQIFIGTFLLITFIAFFKSH